MASAAASQMKAGVGRSPSPNHSGTMSGSPKTGPATAPIFDSGSAAICGLTPPGLAGVSERASGTGTSGNGGRPDCAHSRKASPPPQRSNFQARSLRFGDGIGVSHGEGGGIFDPLHGEAGADVVEVRHLDQALVDA